MSRMLHRLGWPAFLLAGALAFAGMAVGQTAEPVGRGYAIHKPGEPTTMVQPDGRGGWTAVQQGKPTTHIDPSPSPRGGTDWRVWSNKPGDPVSILPRSKP